MAVAMIYDRPDFLHFDLDPGPGADFQRVCDVAMKLRDLLDGIHMPTYPKTTGSKGFICMCRSSANRTKKKCGRSLKKSLRRWNSLSQVGDRRISNCERPYGRVLVDYNQNAWGRTLASIYSVRPKPLATVSMPVTWDDIETGIQLADYRLDNVPTFFRKPAISGKDCLASNASIYTRLQRLRRPDAVIGRSRISTARKLEPGAFPDLSLPVPLPLPPMEATRVDQLPDGDEWQFEPKWDGFRCLVFRKGQTVALQSKSGQPLTRYFPELVQAFQSLPSRAFVLDGEIVVAQDGRLSFDALLLRIHPAASRVANLRTTRLPPLSRLIFCMISQRDAAHDPATR